MSDFRPVEGEFTGRHMLYIMIAFFGVVIAVNVAMAMVASRSWTGLVVENSYVASQHFNEELAAAREQEKLGWQSALAVTGRSARVRITFDEGEAVTGLSVQLGLSRPTYEADDQVVQMSETAPGEYAAEVSLKPGAWNAELTAQTRSGKRYRKIHRLIVEDTGS